MAFAADPLTVAFCETYTANAVIHVVHEEVVPMNSSARPLAASAPSNVRG